MKEGYNCIGMAPVVDGPGGFLPEMPEEIRKNGNHNKVPEMIGANTEDGYLFVPLGNAEAALKMISMILKVLFSLLSTARGICFVTAAIKIFHNNIIAIC